MQYIKTKYMGPTNHRGSRVKAVSSYGKTSITVSWDNERTAFDNHKAAALALIEKLDWGGTRYCAGSADDHYVFVPVCDRESFEVTK